MTCTKGQDLRRYIVEDHKRLSGDKIVVDVFLEVGQYVPGRISTLGGKSPGEERYRGGSARPSVRADERTRTAFPLITRAPLAVWVRPNGLLAELRPYHPNASPEATLNGLLVVAPTHRCRKRRTATPLFLGTHYVQVPNLILAQ